MTTFQPPTRGDRLTWTTRNGEQITVTVCSSDKFHVWADDYRMLYEATCFWTLEEALAHVTIIRHHDNHHPTPT
jgi:hypothetical protein